MRPIGMNEQRNEIFFYVLLQLSCLVACLPIRLNSSDLWHI